MRITNSMMIDNMLRNLNNGLGRVNKYHNQLASNRRIVKLSDDPIGVLNSMGARQQIRRLEQYQRNVDTSRAWVVQSESSVTEMEEAIVNIKELLTDAMGTENNDDKKIFATQIRQVTENILELCNSSMGDKYIFGGFNVTNQPFTAERDATGKLVSVKYNGLDLTGKNVTFGFGAGDVEPPDFAGIAQGSGITDLQWAGQMDPTGTYKVSLSDPDADGQKSLILTNTSDSRETYNVHLAQMPKDLKAGETVKVDLIADDGTNFGTISWKPVAADDGTLTPVTENDILEMLDSAMTSNTVGSSTAVNSEIVPGPTTPDGMKWLGTLADTSQKYTMQVDGSKITFINAFGSVAGSVDLAKLDPPAAMTPAVDDDGNPMEPARMQFTVDLKDDVTGTSFGTVTFSQAAKTVDEIEFPDGISTDPEKIAYLIGQSGFVSTRLGEESTQHIQFEIGYNMDIDVTFTGIDLVGTGEDNMFNVLINLASDLDKGMRNEDLTHYLTKLTTVQDRLLQSVMKCGNRTTKLETMDNRYSFDAINYESTRSSIEDIDQAKVISQMKYAEMIYKQALASGAQIIQPTLMDFLR